MTLDDFRKRVVLVDDIEGEPDPATQSNVRRLIEARLSDPRVGPVVVSYGPGPTWPEPATPPTGEDVERDELALGHMRARLLGALVSMAVARPRKPVVLSVETTTRCPPPRGRR